MASAESDFRPRNILLLSLDPEEDPKLKHARLLDQLTAKAHVDIIRTPESAAQLVCASIETALHFDCILLPDAAVTKAQLDHLWRGIVTYVRAGGVVVCMGQFASSVEPQSAQKLFERAGLPWIADDYPSRDFALNEGAFGNGISKSLPPVLTCKPKAIRLKYVRKEDAWYREVDLKTSDGEGVKFLGNRACVAFASVGAGRLGFVGDFERLQSWNRSSVVLEMCGLLDPSTSVNGSMNSSSAHDSLRHSTDQLPSGSVMQPFKMRLIEESAILRRRRLITPADIFDESRFINTPSRQQAFLPVHASLPPEAPEPVKRSATSVGPETEPRDRKDGRRPPSSPSEPPAKRVKYDAMKSTALVQDDIRNYMILPDGPGCPQRIFPLVRQRGVRKRYPYIIIFQQKMRNFIQADIRDYLARGQKPRNFPIFDFASKRLKPKPPMAPRPDAPPNTRSPPPTSQLDLPSDPGPKVHALSKPKSNSNRLQDNSPPACESNSSRKRKPKPPPAAGPKPIRGLAYLKPMHEYRRYLKVTKPWLWECSHCQLSWSAKPAESREKPRISTHPNHTQDGEVGRSVLAVKISGLCISRGNGNVPSMSVGIFFSSNSRYNISRAIDPPIKSPQSSLLVAVIEALKKIRDEVLPKRDLNLRTKFRDELQALKDNGVAKKFVKDNSHFGALSPFIYEILDLREELGKKVNIMGDIVGEDDIDPAYQLARSAIDDVSAWY